MEEFYREQDRIRGQATEIRKAREAAEKIESNLKMKEWEREQEQTALADWKECVKKNAQDGLPITKMKPCRTQSKYVSDAVRKMMEYGFTVKTYCPPLKNCTIYLAEGVQPVIYEFKTPAGSGGD